MRRVLHGVSAALGLAVFAIAVPVLLVRVGGWPLPTRIPNWSNVYWSARQQHIPAEFVVKSIAVVAWLVWIQLMWAVVWELVVNMPRQLRGQRAADAPGAWDPLARLARSLVAPLMLLSTLGPSSAASAAPALATLSATPWSAGVGAAASPAVVLDLSRPSEEAPRWVVEAGDTLWDIAEQCLGDGSAVDRVLDCNPGMLATQRLRAGMAITLPVGAVVPHERSPRTAEPTTSDDTGDVAATNAASPAQDTTYSVVPGDTLWDIADEQLGDPTRWPEVFDLNVGRTFADGRSLADPDLIHPGWELALPADAASEGEVGAAAPGAGDVADGERSDDPSDVGGGDSGRGAQQRGTEDEGAPVEPAAEAVVEPVVAPVGGIPAWRTDGPLEGGAHPAADELVDDAGDLRPVNDWVAESPPAAAVVPGVERSINSVVELPAPSSTASEATDADAPQVVTLSRAAMLASGALVLLGVRRRRSLRTARPRTAALIAGAGSRTSPPPPCDAAIATERMLRAVAADERFARVDLAVRASALSLIAHRQRVLAVLAAPDGVIELVPTGPVDLPSPWARAGDRWRLPGEVSLEDLAPSARGIATPAPALVQIGVDGERDVYVDLEAIGALEVDAPPAQADSIVQALAATLSTSVLAEVATLVGAAVPDEAFCGHSHHQSAGTAEEAIRTAVRSIGSTTAAATSTFELRARGTGGEAWEPAIVVVGSANGEVELGHTPQGVAVVSAAPIVGPSSVLAPDGDAWVLRPAGLRLSPIGVTADELSAVSDLLQATAIVDRADLDEGPESADPADVERPALEHRLLVRLLGPVRVESADGQPAAFERSKARELVAWLATHRERATRTLARTALWEIDVRDATFSNVAWDARRALATVAEPPDGSEWIGRTNTEELPLHELVVTDAELLADALDRARRLSAQEAIMVLEPAVARVVGMPFEGTTYLWPDAEGITSNLVLLATAAAGELAERYLEVGDVEGVFRATDHGLRVLPGHEELIGLRMQAHARVGDHAGIRLEWETYSRTLLADPWSDGEPSPKLLELRSELLGHAAA